MCGCTWTHSETDLQASWFHLLHHLDLPKDCSLPYPSCPSLLRYPEPSFHTYDRCYSFGLYLNYCIRVPSHFPPCPTQIFQHLLSHGLCLDIVPVAISGYSCVSKILYKPVSCLCTCAYIVLSPWSTITAWLVLSPFSKSIQILHLLTPPSTQSKIPSVQSLYTFKWPFHCTCYTEL